MSRQTGPVITEFKMSGRYHLFAKVLAGTLFAMSSAVFAAPVTGLWRATVDVGGGVIPFRLALKESAGTLEGHFFDGTRSINPSSAGSIDHGKLRLDFASYGAFLEATVDGDRLDGIYARDGDKLPIHAVRAAEDVVPSSGGVPDISGEWIIPYASQKGETAWRLIIHQTGSALEASILRIDGDTGTLDGTYAAGAFHVSHYAGERAAKLDITPATDGSLSLVLTDSSGPMSLKALRPQQAQAQGATPSDPTQHTRLRNPDEALAFAFPDLHGQPVSNTDARFKGKVVLVNLMGSWCPNCHDEAPFLGQLYAKYRERGLEIVALDFELTPAQVSNPARVRAFIDRYQIKYPVLLAGLRKEVATQLPQAVNLNAWPTTFFVGRDGKVHSVHVGFTSPGSGQRDTEMRAAITQEIETLLGR